MIVREAFIWNEARDELNQEEMLHMSVERISLMDAYMIETLRSNGVSNEEIIGINDEAIEQWGSINKSFDFSGLKKLATNETAFSSILQEGYTIKFLTYNGLMNLLRIRFAKEPDRDFMKEEQGVKDLRVNDHQLATIQQMLSPNWTVVPSQNSDTVSIYPTE